MDEIGAGWANFFIAPEDDIDTHDAPTVESAFAGFGRCHRNDPNDSVPPIHLVTVLSWVRLSASRKWRAINLPAYSC